MPDEEAAGSGEVGPKQRTPSLASRAIATVNLLGSIASVTGVSLLWLRDTKEFNPWLIVRVAIIVSLTLAQLTVMVLFFKKYWDFFGEGDPEKNQLLVVRILLCLVGIPILSMVGIFIWMLWNVFIQLFFDLIKVMMTGFSH